MKKLLIIFFVLCSCKFLETEAQRIEKMLPLYSAEELFEKGNQAMKEGKYNIAKLYFKFLVDNFPSSPYAVDSLLNLAEACFLNGKWEDIIAAKQRFSDFYNRYPQNEKAEYALYMQGIISLKLKESPTKDQINTLNALSIFKRYLQIYPNGKYLEEVKKGIKECNKNLALHELEVAKFYFKRKAYTGALKRLDYILKTFPDFEEMEKVYFLYYKVYEKKQDIEKKEYYFKKYKETLDIKGKVE